MDYDFMWRMAERFGGVNLSEPLLHYTVRRQSISSEQFVQQQRAAEVIRGLARMRADGRDEDVEACIAAVGGRDEIDNGKMTPEMALVFADRTLLAGGYVQALRVYVRGVTTRPFRSTGWKKLVRWVLFLLLPHARKRLFRSWRGTVR